MRCRHCGTEIADKAIICYKCGEDTTDRQYEPPAARPRHSRAALILTFIGLLLLAIVAVFLSRTAPSGTPPWVTWVVAAIAIVVVALRAYARRR